MAAAFVAGAMSVDACLGSDVPFDPRIQALRGHRGQIDAAAIYRTLLEGSEIRASHAHCHRVQDPYSLRCQPQVMGACLDQMRHAAATLITEANAVSDNPLVFPGRRRNPLRRQLSCGARCLRGRQSCPCDCRDRRIVRTAHRAPGRRAPVGIAALPRRGRGRQLRVHDRAGNGRSARLGKQGARASAQRRLAAHVREPGRSRQHGHGRGAAPAAMAATRRPSSQSSCSPRRRGSNCASP